MIHGLTSDEVNGCLPESIPELVEVVSAGRVDPILHQAAEVPLARAGEVALQGVGARVLTADDVTVIRPHAVKSIIMRRKG